MANFGDDFRYYKDSEIVLDDFNYYSDVDIASVYSYSGDATAVTVRTPSDTPNWKIGNYAGRFSATHSTGASLFYATIQSKDLSSIVGVNTGAPLGGYLRMAIVESATSWMTTIRIGNDASNYAAYSLGTLTASEFEIKEIDMTTAAITGTVDWTAIDYIAFVGATATGGSRTTDISGIRVTPTTRVTNSVWNEPTSQMTNTNSSSLFFIDTIGTEYVLRHPQDETVNTTEIINDVATLSYGNSFTIKSKFKWQQGGGTGYEIGVAFHISDTTKASQDCYVAYIDESDNQINFDKFVAGTRTNLATVSFTPTVNTPYFMKVENNNGTFTISTSTDGLSYTTRIVKADSTFTGGRVGTYSCSSPDAMFYNFYAYDNVSVMFGGFSMHERGWFNLTDVQEDSMPTSNVYTLTTAGGNKETFINKNYGAKYISVRGTISTPSAGDLTRSIDDFKSALSSSNRTLTISKPSGTSGKFYDRVYTATAINTDKMIERTDWNLTYIPFNVVFMCPDGVAVDTNSQTFSSYAWSSSQIQRTFHFDGSYNSQPIFTYTLTDATPASGSFNQVIFYNDRTNRSITITPTNNFADGDVLVLDFNSKVVTINGTNVAFDGIMDDQFFLPGENTTRAIMGSSSTLDQSQDAYTSDKKFVVPTQQSQGFKVSTTTTYSTFSTLLKGTGRISGIFTVRVETDTAGSPSGSLVSATATKTLNAAFTGSEPQWFNTTLNTAVSLTAGTQYHLVVIPVSITPVTLSSTIAWAYSSANPYTSGSAYGLTSSDYAFRVYQSGVSGISGTLVVSYSPRYI